MWIFPYSQKNHCSGMYRITKKKIYEYKLNIEIINGQNNQSEWRRRKPKIKAMQLYEWQNYSNLISNMWELRIFDFD